MMMGGGGREGGGICERQRLSKLELIKFLLKGGCMHG